MFFMFRNWRFGGILLAIDVLCASYGRDTSFWNIVAEWAFLDFGVSKKRRTSAK